MEETTSRSRNLETWGPNKQVYPREQSDLEKQSLSPNDNGNFAHNIQYPVVVNTGTCTRKISHENYHRLLSCACHAQERPFQFGICYLSTIVTNYPALLRTVTQCRSQDLVVAVAQRQWQQGIGRVNETCSFINMVGFMDENNCATGGKSKVRAVSTQRMLVTIEE